MKSEPLNDGALIHIWNFFYSNVAKFQPQTEYHWLTDAQRDGD